MVHSYHAFLILHGPRFRFCEFICSCVMIVRKTFSDTAFFDFLQKFRHSTLFLLFQKDVLLPKRSLYKMLN